MALTATSTIDDALAQLNANLAWDGDASKAALALEAVRFLLINRAASSTARGTEINYASLADLETRLADYVQSAPDTDDYSPFTRADMLVY